MSNYSYDQLIQMAIGAVRAGYTRSEAAEMFDVTEESIEELLNA